MAMVNISITEYDALRNRAKELEQEKNEYKEDVRKLKDHIESIPIDRVVIEKSTEAFMSVLNRSKLYSGLHEALTYYNYDYCALFANKKHLEKIITDSFDIQTSPILTEEGSIHRTYVGFNDVREQVTKKFEKELKENLKTEEEIRKDLELYFKSTIDSLKLDIQIKKEKHKEYVEKIVSTHMKSVEEYEKIIEDLKEAALPTDQRLDKILKEHGFEVTTTWFGNLKLKKI